MVAGSGLPEEAAMWEWLERQCELPPVEHHVWMMHSALFTESLDEPNYDITDRDQYLNWYFGIDEPYRSRIMSVFKETGATLVLSGHIHCRKRHEAEGIQFHINPSTAFKQWGNHWLDGDDSLGFIEYTVDSQGIRERFVPLAKEINSQRLWSRRTSQTRRSRLFEFMGKMILFVCLVKDDMSQRYCFGVRKSYSRIPKVIGKFCYVQINLTEH